MLVAAAVGDRSSRQRALLACRDAEDDVGRPRTVTCQPALLSVDLRGLLTAAEQPPHDDVRDTAVYLRAVRSSSRAAREERPGLAPPSTAFWAVTIGGLCTRGKGQP